MIRGLASFGIGVVLWMAPVSSSAEEQLDSSGFLEQPEPLEVEEIIIRAQRPMTASSDQTLRALDFKYFPRQTASDLMRLIPGLHITQHTGGAKAHQIFLRGFDAEHGQDVAVYLDGVPINELSHVHGQGYLDLHFLIPEVIRRIHVLKGPYDGRYGNLATAGVIEMITGHHRPYSALVKLGVGRFASYFALAELSIGSTNRGMGLAVQAEQTDGFTEPGGLEAQRVFVRGRTPVWGDWMLEVLYAGYRARSKTADVVPESWIQQGRVDRFGSLDPSNRVNVDRHLVGASLAGPGEAVDLRLIGYFNFKDTRIFSNYTYFLFHQLQGDQMEQSDRRHYGGLRALLEWTASWASEGAWISKLGAEWRMDAIGQTQANTQARERFNQINHYRIREHNAGVFAHETLLLGDRWMLVGGARYDLNLAAVDGFQDVRELDIYTNQVVVREDVPRKTFSFSQAVSPKLSAIYSATDAWQLFVNFGRGFVSRPARDQANRGELWAYGVTGAEIGTRWSGCADRLELGSSLWWMHKDRELVFDAELGGTVFRDQSHRLGMELELRLAPWSWAWVATDLFLTYSRFDTEHGWEPIPNTPWLLMTNLLAVQHPIGLHASLRGRLLGPRRHDLGFTSAAYYIVDMVLAYQAGGLELVLEIQNLLDADWYDSVFAYPVRPAPGEPIQEGLQVTPGTPFSIALYLSLGI